ncbi:MAG: dipeptidase PepE [Bacteroidales bacterium]|nr:dipeptidase PepE [Bacteroidales bacterium]MBQ9313006.1 dipeptidase PepE [Bacteroidales bacterium]
MKRNLLLISNSTNAGEKYLDWCKEMIADFCKENNVKNVLFIPYAGFAQGYDVYEEKVAKVYAEYGIKVHSIHHEQYPINAVMQAECIAIGGGNTFYLVKEMQKAGIMKAIREKAFMGTPYMGWSAGSNVAGLSLKTTNDMPIVEPESFDTMGLVPFQINPHYTDFVDPKHGGETRDDRINEFIAANQSTYVAAIREATALRMKDGKLSLVGRDNKMKVFHFGKPTTEYSLQDDINFLLK